MEGTRTATDGLRALLDARGVEYEARDDVTLWGDRLLTARDGRGTVYRFATDELGGKLNLRALGLAPSQAVEATLGRGECEQVLADCADGLMPPFSAHCGNCGTEWGRTPKFCPGCGARVAGTRDERKAVGR